MARAVSLIVITQKLLKMCRSSVNGLTEGG